MLEEEGACLDGIDRRAIRKEILIGDAGKPGMLLRNEMVAAEKWLIAVDGTQSP